MQESVPLPPKRSVFTTYLLSYSCFRFMVEFVRADDRGGFFTPLQLSPSQLIALGTAVVAIAWLRYCYRRAAA
ncbi:MAG TPA: prolipoprotein diacylglyceryl transferase [Candidatus Rifleibacterium sp.]|nr:prolipoprotein diacylglyceryl transferase [Candidatus Rifleibacterium sp.]